MNGSAIAERNSIHRALDSPSASLPGQPDSAFIQPGRRRASRNHQLNDSDEAFPPDSNALPLSWRKTAGFSVRNGFTQSEPLSEADLDLGQVKFPLLEAKQVLNLWQKSSVTVEVSLHIDHLKASVG